jgi:hypothetical protein
MTRTTAFIFGVLPLLAATTAYAQAQVPQVGGAVRAPQAQAPYTLPGEIVPPEGSQLPPIVGQIGGAPVRVWAPVLAPYDTEADRNGAANPFPMAPDWWPPLPFSG